MAKQDPRAAARQKIQVEMTVGQADALVEAVDWFANQIEVIKKAREPTAWHRNDVEKVRLAAKAIFAARMQQSNKEG